MMSTLPAPSRLDAPPAIDLPTGDPPILITIGETARLLSCSPGLVKLLIRRGQLQPVKLGRLTRIPRVQLIAMFVPAEQQSSRNPESESLQLCSSPARETPRRVGALKRNRHARG